MSTFEPWKGPKYAASNNRFGIKLLVVAESFYLTDANRDNPKYFALNLMKGVIEDKCTWLDPKSNRRKAWKTKFFKKLFYPLTGKRFDQVSDEEWSDVWNSIAYTVYVQTTKLSKPGEYAPGEDLALGPANVLEAVQQLDPDKLLIVGIGVWGHFRRNRPAALQKQEGKLLRPEIAFICHPASRQWYKEQEKSRQTVQTLLKTP